MNPGEPLSIYDPNFQSQHAAKCDLLLSIGEHEIRYAVVDQLQDQVRAIGVQPLTRPPAEQLPTFFESEPFLKFSFRKVKAALASKDFVFIPSDAYQEESLSTYASFIETAGTMTVTHLRTPRIKNVAGLDTDTIAAISRQFVNAHFFGQADPLVEAFLKCYFKPMSNRLFLQFHSQTVEIALFEGKNVVFYNVFDSRTADEFNYFLLLLIRQLKLGSAQVDVTVAGQISENDDYYQRLKKYFNEVAFADCTAFLRLSTSFSEIPRHQYFSLLGINLCE